MSESDSRETVVVERPQVHGGKGSTKDVVDVSEMKSTTEEVIEENEEMVEAKPQQPTKAQEVDK